MSEHEVDIFDADPERVVSVTVGELRSLCRELYADGYCDRGRGLIDGDGVNESLSELVTVHERTCHFVDRDEDGNPAAYRDGFCDRCGEEMDDADRFCPNCGAEVVDE